MRPLRWLALLTCGTALVVASRSSPPPPAVLFGPIVGDVTATSANVWMRVEGLTSVTCELSDAGTVAASLTKPTRTVATRSPFRSDGVTLGFRALRPDTEYEVRVPSVSDEPLRRFRTMRTDAAPIRLAFTADLGGQRIGRDLEQGFAGLPVIADYEPDVFLGLGDMIYADKFIRSQSRLGNRQIPLSNALVLDHRDYWRHWKYLHEDSGFAQLMAQASYVAIWDDHECRGDFGPHEDGGLLETARASLFDWNPVLGVEDEPERLYRALRLSRHCELFVLDCRSYRDPMAARDDQPRPKTMLGRAQREWLLHALEHSDATWKLIVSSVPLTCPSGDDRHGYGGWADAGSGTAYERELLGLLRSIQKLGIDRPVFLCADVHHAEVDELAPFDDSPAFRPLEVVVGPLNAGLFGRAATGLDPTLNPKTLFYLSPNPQPKTFEAAKRYWNFGLIDIDADAKLHLRVVNVAEEVVFELDLPPPPTRHPEAHTPRPARTPTAKPR